MHDYYDSLRAPVNAERAGDGVAGRYDPLNMTIWIEAARQQTIDSNPSDASNDPSPELIDGSATALHEQAHWWQYAGTTAGFTLALLNRIQTGVTAGLLEKLDVPSRVKPLFRLHEVRHDLLDKGPENHAINDWFDLEYGAFLLAEPDRVEVARGDRFFESFGRSLCILHERLPMLLARSSIGAEALLAGERDLADDERRLIDAGTPNFAREANVMVPRIGTLAIFEGHARLQELRYRSMARGKAMDWNEAHERGYLGPLYRRALESFLAVAGLSPPPDVMAPEVAVFLAVCDVALFPTVGYPDAIERLDRLPIDASPGCRFDRAATALRKVPALLSLVRGDARSWPLEYRTFTEALCQVCGFETPWSVAARILTRAEQSGLRARAEDVLTTARVDSVTAPLDVFVAMHLRALAMRVEFPELPAWTDLAWAGCRVLGDDVRARYVAAGARVSAPFYLNANTGLPSVSLAIGPDEDARQRLGQSYFFAQALADITRQWMARNGPFRYEFCFTRRAELLEPDIRATFERQFGIDPSQVRVL